MKQTIITEEQKLELFEFVKDLQNKQRKTDYEIGAYYAAQTALCLMKIFKEYQEWEGESK